MEKCGIIESMPYKDKDKQKKAQLESYHRNKHKKMYDPQKKRNTMLKSKYGITIEQFNELLEYQGGGCAICGAAVDQHEDRSLPVDHDEETGEVRGILCSHCNRAIGLFEHNIDMVQSAIDYLKNPHARDIWEVESDDDDPPTFLGEKSPGKS